MLSSAVKTVLYVVSGIILFFGILFIMASYANSMRLCTGTALIAIALAIVFYIRWKEPTRVEVHQTIELPSGIEMEKLQCRSCGATLKAENVNITNAGVIVRCPYCGSVYRLEEEPKW